MKEYRFYHIIFLLYVVKVWMKHFHVMKRIKNRSHTEILIDIRIQTNFYKKQYFGFVLKRAFIDFIPLL